MLLTAVTVAVMHAQDDSRVQSLLAEADACISRNNLTEALEKTREALADFTCRIYLPCRNRSIFIS